MILILDIDGTLSDASHRAHYVDCDKPDWTGFLQPHLVLQDTLIPGAKRGFDHLKRIADRVIFLTGRNESLRVVTTEWLKINLGVDADTKNLFMRPIDDNRVPSEYKMQALFSIEDALYAEGLNSLATMAIDDDKYMMGIYRELGYVTVHAPECWKVLFPDFDHLTEETTWRK